jgi:hypothetical protein
MEAEVVCPPPDNTGRPTNPGRPPAAQAAPADEDSEDDVESDSDETPMMLEESDDESAGIEAENHEDPDAKRPPEIDPAL